jgi:16S rRNA (adenine1518-N6/adenine1519-N6)-dimethyltransferase
MPQNDDRRSVRPKKHLGQHFLKDLEIARKIALALKPIEGHCIVEIGPGMGVLSEYLVEQVRDRDIIYYLVEFDKESVSYLNNNAIYKAANIHILNEDVLKYNWRSTNRTLDLIGNLPYNISSPIFFEILDHLEIVNSGVFMVQKEVADRICASHGSKVYGILSVLIQAYFDCKLLFDVAPGAFYPPPKVTSSVFRIERKKESPDISLISSLKSLVKKSFNQRRKMLRNTIGTELRNMGSEVEKYLTLRPEQLSVEDFIFIAGRLES